MVTETGVWDAVVSDGNEAVEEEEHSEEGMTGSSPLSAHSGPKMSSSSSDFIPGMPGFITMSSSPLITRPAAAAAAATEASGAVGRPWSGDTPPREAPAAAAAECRVKSPTPMPAEGGTIPAAAFPMADPPPPMTEEDAAATAPPFC